MIGTAGGVETVGTLGDPSTDDALISGVHRTQGQTGMTPVCPDPSGDAEPFRRLELLPTHTWQSGNGISAVGVVVVMASYLSCGLLAPSATSSQVVHAPKSEAQKPALNCANTGARYWDSISRGLPNRRGRFRLICYLRTFVVTWALVDHHVLSGNHHLAIGPPPERMTGRRHSDERCVSLGHRG